jgi:hypothetical protein
MYDDLSITIPENPDFSAHASLERVEYGGELRVITTVPLPIGSHVSIKGSGKYFTSGNVIESAKVRGAYRALVRTSSERDRRHARVSVDEETWMHLFHDSDRTAYPVRVIDVSESGIGLVAKQDFLRGSLVELKFMEGLILAKVRNCERMGALAYRVGVEIQTVMFSEERVQPGPTEPLHWWSAVLKKLSPKSRQ